jgi:sugar/nucleoside kinase (ribokinase family)
LLNILLLGAGDVFLGAMAYSILCGYSTTQMMRLGAVVAAMKCRYSSVKGIPTLKDIDTEWINQI